MRTECLCWVQGAPQVWACHKYLYVNVGLAVETNLHVNSGASDLDSPPKGTNRCIPASPSDMH